MQPYTNTKIFIVVSGGSVFNFGPHVHLEHLRLLSSFSEDQSYEDVRSALQYDEAHSGMKGNTAFDMCCGKPRNHGFKLKREKIPFLVLSSLCKSSVSVYLRIQVSSFKVHVLFTFQKYLSNQVVFKSVV